MKKKVAVFGAGIAGLAAAKELACQGHEVDVYEALDHVGGLASTYRDLHGFVYDHGPHFVFSSLAFQLGIEATCRAVRYYEQLYVKGRTYLFPFGFVKNPAYCCSIALAIVRRLFVSRPTNLQEFLHAYYGKTFSQEVLLDLIEKWSGMRAEEMSVDLAHRLLPTNISYVLYSLVKKLRGGITEDYYKKGRYIVYPQGGLSKLFEALMCTQGLTIHLRSPLERLKTKGGVIVKALVGGREISADAYLSTIPMSDLLQCMDKPEAVQNWRELRYRGMMILFVKLLRPKVLDALWTWFPEKQYPFYRISEYKNVLPDLAPADKTLISVEIGCNPRDPFWNLDAEAVFATVAKPLRELYGIERKDILDLDCQKSPAAYPVLSKATEGIRRDLTHATPFSNLFLAGRTGMCQYTMLEGSYESGRSCVRAIQNIWEGKKVSEAKALATDRYGRPRQIPE